MFEESSQSYDTATAVAERQQKAQKQQLQQETAGWLATRTRQQQKNMLRKGNYNGSGQCPPCTYE